MEGDIGAKMNIDNIEGYTTSGYALLQGEMLASLSIDSKKRKAEPSKKRSLVIVDSDLEEDDEKEQETDTFSGGYQTQTRPAKKAKVAKPRFYATRCAFSKLSMVQLMNSYMISATTSTAGPSTIPIDLTGVDNADDEQSIMHLTSPISSAPQTPTPNFTQMPLS
ncbi:hypothetical protein DXG01_014662, partial [Tephrocybe rancida]